MRSLLSILLLLLGGSTAPAATFVVRPDGTGDAVSIQAAVDAAVDGDQIVLAEGTFTGQGNRDVCIRDKTLTLRSAGADPGACRIDTQGSASDPHRFLVLRQSDSVVSGLTAAGGFVDFMEEGWGGGAVYSSGGSPIFMDCIFESNVATNLGGAISALNSPLRFERCVFRENAADQGGAIVCATSAGAPVGLGPRIRDCTFLRNSARVGGAVEFRSHAGGSFENTTFSGNDADQGGAIYCDHDVALTVATSTFSGNQARQGSCVFFQSGSTMASFENVLVTGHFGTGTFWLSEPMPALTFGCTNIHGNASGDWTGSLAGFLGVNGNICADPLFCAVDPDASQYWYLRTDSPCAASDSGCACIGAWPVGCATTAHESSSWGNLKRKFR